MKKLLGIVVVSLLLSGNAYAIKLTECFLSENTFNGEPDNEEVEDSFDPNKFEVSSYEIDFQNGLINRQIIRTEKFLKKTNIELKKDGHQAMDKVHVSNRKITYADERIIRSIVTTKDGTMGNGGMVVIESVNTQTIDLLENKVTTKYVTTISVAGIPKSTDTMKYIQSCNKSESSSQGVSSSGSGFFINNQGYFVTNNHVVKGCKQSKITFKEEEVDAELIATDETLDLALLRAKVKPKDYLNISDEQPEKMQKVFVAGYPFGKGLSDDLKFTQGIISAVKGYADNSNQIQLDAAINSGNSGGPIVNEDGDLVAVAVSGLDKSKAEGIGFGIKASSVKNFLEVNNTKYSSSSLINFGMNNKKLNKLMEASTVYTFCN